MSSDRGSQFTSYLLDSILQLLGTKPHHTIAYRPQSNGLVEQFHHHLKSAVRARLTSPNWFAALLWALLEIQTAQRRTWDVLQQSWFMVPLSQSQAIANQSHQMDHNVSGFNVCVIMCGLWPLFPSPSMVRLIHQFLQTCNWPNCFHPFRRPPHAPTKTL